MSDAATVELEDRELAMAWLAAAFIIAILHDKGGVGKTSTTAAFAAALAAAGYRVLVIDMNGQGNLREEFGIRDSELDDDGLAMMLAVASGRPFEPVSMPDHPGIDMVVGGLKVEDVKHLITSWASTSGKAEKALAKCLAPIAANYNVVLFDSPPEHPITMRAIMAAARWVLVPTKPDASSRLGVARVAQVWSEARRWNPFVEVLGTFLFASSIKENSAKAKAIHEKLQAILGPYAPVLPEIVPYVESVAIDVREYGLPAPRLEAELFPDGVDVEGKQSSVNRIADAWARLVGHSMAEINRRFKGGEPVPGYIQVDVGDPFSDADLPEDDSAEATV